MKGWMTTWRDSAGTVYIINRFALPADDQDNAEALLVVLTPMIWRDLELMPHGVLEVEWHDESMTIEIAGHRGMYHVGNKSADVYVIGGPLYEHIAEERGDSIARH